MFQLVVAVHLAGVPQIVPQNVKGRTQCRLGSSESKRKKNGERGVFLAESLRRLFPEIFAAGKFAQREVCRADRKNQQCCQKYALYAYFPVLLEKQGALS